MAAGDIKGVEENAGGTYNEINLNTKYPIISSGTTSPSSTPTKVGDIYVDTTNKILWVATGTSSSADWQSIN